MQILDNFIILAIHVACFIAGLKLSDHYHEKAQARADYESRLAAARQEARDMRVYVSPERKTKPMPIGQAFIDKMQAEGRATQQINREKPIA